MYILERSVTKPYWEASYRFIVRRFDRGEAIRVAPAIWRIRGTGAGNRLYYAYLTRTDRGLRPMAWLILEHRDCLGGYGVEQVWTFPEFRNRGLALRLYRAAIDRDCLTVVSGRSHTKFSRAFWEKLIRRQVFTIWAQRYGASPKRFKVEWDAESSSIRCATPLYTTYRRPDRAVINVRLYAKKRKHK